MNSCNLSETFKLFFFFFTNTTTYIKSIFGCVFFVTTSHITNFALPYGSGSCFYANKYADLKVFFGHELSQNRIDFRDLQEV